MTTKESGLSNDPKELYIDLMVKILMNSIYQDSDLRGSYQDASRENGHDWPSIAHTMIGEKRLRNICYCVKEVLENNIPGDLIETGVWRGGATILMRAILQAYGDRARKVWVADSFAGLPAPNPSQYPVDAGDLLHTYAYLAVPLEEVQANFSKYGLLDTQVVFLKGLFSKTLPSAPIDKISVLRLDGDLYESTMDALVNLYPKLSAGGYLIIDDYGAVNGCRVAVTDYREKYQLKEEMIPIDWTGVFWKKRT